MSNHPDTQAPTFQARSPFGQRHIGPSEAEQAEMLAGLGYASLDELTDAAVPDSIRVGDGYSLPAGRTNGSAGLTTGSAGLTTGSAGLTTGSAGRTEEEVQLRLREIASQNRPMCQMIGMGYHDTVMPAVIRRNVLENPAWYTAYTPYQAEISQGRLEALLVFQTMVSDLTGLPVANASLLDEASAAAEAMTLCRRQHPPAPSPAAGEAAAGRPTFVVDADCLPQTIAVLRTRAQPLGIDLVVRDLTGTGAAGSRAGGPGAHVPAGLPEGKLDGVLFQYPGASGAVVDLAPMVAEAHQRGALVVVAADPLALCLLRPPGELGADVAIGSTQRFGVPLGFGGPHAAYIAVRHGLERSLPGRVVGVSRDPEGSPALRLAVQTREQHIRRERATSNICTAQVLPAVLAAMYAVYHGPEGLRRIAKRAHRHATALAAQLRQRGVEVVHPVFFDTVLAQLPGGAEAVVTQAEARGVNLRLVDADHLAVACDERTSTTNVDQVLGALLGAQRSLDRPTMLAAAGSGPEWRAEAAGSGPQTEAAGSGPEWRAQAAGSMPPTQAAGSGPVTQAAGSGPLTEDLDSPIPAQLSRTSEYLTHSVFRRHRSETSMLRYLRQLSDRDYALDRGMIPLGSCTMKLNATFEMESITWPELSSIHPFAPAHQAQGYAQLIGDLEGWLGEITGFDAVSLQPNAGSQGELAGLLAIRAYQRDQGEGLRDVCLIPTSAHGTNAASARLAGMRVVPVACDEHGNVDLVDLAARIADHSDRLSALMVTYPSTHGVYEEAIAKVCDAVRDAGGLVYLDGANMNALLGLATLSGISDVCHLNLHKTFCIPHGGGGPGVGPVAVRRYLSDYLPADPLRPDRIPPRADGERPRHLSPGPISAAPWGSAGVLPITWAYIRIMGSEGLRLASQVAVLSANYLAKRIGEHFPVLYTGRRGLVAHECIVDLRALTRATGVTATDVAKRLIDYGFHAPTVSFPVAGTLMVEPTESEDLAELDRFCDAMAGIRAEIDRVAAGEWPAHDNPLKNAPHTAASLAAGWDHPYSREEAAYPAPYLRRSKYWPPVGRVDESWGDRHLLTRLPDEE